MCNDVPLSTLEVSIRSDSASSFRFDTLTAECGGCAEENCSSVITPFDPNPTFQAGGTVVTASVSCGSCSVLNWEFIITAPGSILSNDSDNSFKIRVELDEEFLTFFYTEGGQPDAQGGPFDIPVLCATFVGLEFGDTSETILFSVVPQFTSTTIFKQEGPTTMIPDLKTVKLPIVVPQDGIVQSIRVLDIQGTHTFFGDLSFELEAPDNTTITLLAPLSCSGTGSFKFSITDDANDFPTVFNNFCGTTPTGGGTSWLPTVPLSYFTGKSLMGTWSLNITDNEGDDTGSLTHWCLQIAYSSPRRAAGDLELHYYG